MRFGKSKKTAEGMPDALGIGAPALEGMPVSFKESARSMEKDGKAFQDVKLAAVYPRRTDEDDTPLFI